MTEQYGILWAVVVQKFRGKSQLPFLRALSLATRGKMSLGLSH